MIKKKLNSLTHTVMKILQLHPETRDSDRELILRVYHEYGVGSSDPFAYVIGRKDLPPFESIRRARQKLQAEIPELRASDKVDAMRTVEQEEYREYAKEPLGV